MVFGKFSTLFDVIVLAKDLAKQKIDQIYIKDNILYYKDKEIDLNPATAFYDLNKFYNDLIHYSSIASIINYLNSKGYSKVPYATFIDVFSKDNEVKIEHYYVAIKEDSQVLIHLVAIRNYEENEIKIFVAQDHKYFRPLNEYFTNENKIKEILEKLKFENVFELSPKKKWLF